MRSLPGTASEQDAGRSPGRLRPPSTARFQSPRLSLLVPSPPLRGRSRSTHSHPAKRWVPDVTHGLNGAHDPRPNSASVADPYASYPLHAPARELPNISGMEALGLQRSSTITGDEYLSDFTGSRGGGLSRMRICLGLPSYRPIIAPSIIYAGLGILPRTL